MKNKKITDKDGIDFTLEEVKEYENDLWDGRVYDSNPVAAKSYSIKMWNKWGKRLGFPHPDSK